MLETEYILSVFFLSNTGIKLLRIQNQVCYISIRVILKMAAILIALGNNRQQFILLCATILLSFTEKHASLMYQIIY